jgi:hypothetical protein
MLALATSFSISAKPETAASQAAVEPTASATETTSGTPTTSGTASIPAAAATSNEPEGRRTALVATLTLKVIHPKETRKQLEQRVRELGGFAVLVTDHDLHVKLPPSRLSTLVDGVSGDGLVLDRSLERSDLTLEIANLESQQKSKRAILAELRGFFDGSDVAATLEIERSMTALVEELERVKGQLRVLYDRADWAVVRIGFEFKERQRITEETSPFEWLNSVNLPRFLAEF